MQLSLLRILAGFVLLFLGRRLFWLFVGVLGFSAGFVLATQYFSAQPQWLVLVIAVVCGLIGILLAFFLQRAAIAIAGFLAGAQFAMALVESAGWNVAAPIPYLVGGILGAILLSVLFDWALIFFSSVSGAILIARALPVEPQFAILAFVVLTILGIFVQARFLEPAVRSNRQVSNS